VSFLSHRPVGDANRDMRTPTDTDRYSALPGIMARMAERDPSALDELLACYGPTLASVMRSHLTSMGWQHPGPDEAHDLMMEAALELWDHAGSWRPEGGSLPWWWAGARLRAIAAEYIGQHADNIDGREVEAPSGTSGGWGHNPMATLRRLGRQHAEVAVLAEVLAEAASERDQAVFLEFCEEAASGNRSPAVTVGVQRGMTPAAVRKVVERVRRRIGGRSPLPLGGGPALAA
jgi:DNA-directed RNA polymerase specialized sigma24 family protein